MVPPEYRIFLFMAVAGLAGAFLGAMLIYKSWRRVYGAFLAAHVLAGLALYLQTTTPGNSNIVYALYLWLFVAPATLGMVLGGGLVWLFQRRR